MDLNKNLKYLLTIQKDVQESWAENKGNVEKDSTKPKYFVTFPYPYMNGRLHLGHAFTITKAEFTSRFKKLKGYNVLFPFAFHCTGMPIQAAANKLKLELFNKTISEDKMIIEEEDQIIIEEEDQRIMEKKFSSAKSKVASKSEALSQSQILIKNGIPENEVENFTDPLHWLKYFPPLGKKDLQLFGINVDWRRSFVTTKANPFYDSFIRWQFNTLRKLNKIDFGKRPTIYSLIDQQVCADHDRSSGEGVQTQEYTLIKLKIQMIPDNIKKLIGENDSCFFVGSTLRPETMYGQTNCFLNPEGDYGLFQMKNNEIFICTERSMKNMMMQDLTVDKGKYYCYGTLKGNELLGIPLTAPLCKYSAIYTLPMKTILMNKGTGVVIGVPSDSPDDYITLKELQDKPELRNSYGLSDYHVDFPLVEIIDIPEIGSRAGETICDKLKIKSPSDTVLLKQAKNMVYQAGFYKGVMKVGNYIGTKVFEAKPLVKNDLYKSNLAIPYWEPESIVISRSGDECVVAQIDQWYIKYGEEEWRNAVEVWIKSSNFNTFSSIVQESFEQTLIWLREWACTRSFGLGTNMPWDPQFVIESLSDSTIYMAYYTFAHLLHPTSFDGSIIGPLGIMPNEMTDSAWDYILLDKPYISGPSQEKLDQMKDEFNYWYPVDLRVSGKDLIQNHLTMSLYNHSAIWANHPDRMPQAFYCNGHVMVDDEKMSKSKGNFIVLKDAIETWTSDAVRFSLAMSGDIIDDANFRRVHAEEAMVHLIEEDTFIKENTMYEDLYDGDCRYADFVFNEKISKYIMEIEKSYNNMRFRDVIMSNGFFELRNARNYYKDMCKKQGILMNRQVVNRFMESLITILSPICPHYCEYAWKKLLKKDIEMTWPEIKSINKTFIEKDIYLNLKIHEFRKSKGKNKSITIVTTEEFPEWQKIPLIKLASLWNDGGFPDDIKKIMIDFVKGTPLLKPYITKLMSIITNTIEKQNQNNFEIIPILQLKLDFNEVELWKDNLEYVRKSLELDTINIERLTNIDKSLIDCNNIAPLQPVIIFNKN